MLAAGAWAQVAILASHWPELRKVGRSLHPRPLLERGCQAKAFELWATMIENEIGNGNDVITIVTEESCPYAGIGQKVGDAESTLIMWKERGSAATPIPRACW